jgi:hypothetical protein
MTPIPAQTSEILGMSDQFWSSVIGALVGALAAGIISALIARAVFKAERKARDADQVARDKRQLRADRTRAVAHIVALINENSLPNRYLYPLPIEIWHAAISLLALDPTDEGQQAFDFINRELGKATPNDPNHMSDTEIAGHIESALIYWVRHDNSSDVFAN